MEESEFQSWRCRQVHSNGGNQKDRGKRRNKQRTRGPMVAFQKVLSSPADSILPFSSFHFQNTNLIGRSFKLGFWDKWLFSTSIPKFRLSLRSAPVEQHSSFWACKMFCLHISITQVPTSTGEHRRNYTNFRTTPAEALGNWVTLKRLLNLNLVICKMTIEKYLPHYMRIKWHNVQKASGGMSGTWREFLKYSH